MKNELISMVSFVLDKEPNIKDDPFYFANAVLDYANFLSEPLNLGMFVPAIEVDGKWEVLEEPKAFKYFNVEKGVELTVLGLECEQFKQALENVLFEGFEVRKVDIEFTYIINPIYNSIGLNLMFNNMTSGIVTKGVEKVNDLLRFEPTLTKKGQAESGLN